MRIFLSLFLIFISCSFAHAHADTIFIVIHSDAFSGTVEDHPSHNKNAEWKERFVARIKKKYGSDNKTVAAIFAFPILGIVGLHRIYLGTKPYVPVVYVATLGGCAGILPFIDFVAILISDKETFETFKNNPRVFMWAK